MTLIDYLYQDLPEYSHDMYLRGYTTEQIFMAHRRMMFENIKEREEPDEVEEFVKMVMKEFGNK